MKSSELSKELFNWITSYNLALEYPEDMILKLTPELKKELMGLSSLKYLTLYRGLYQEEKEHFKGPIGNSTYLHSRDVISSWTKDLEIAKKFAETGPVGLILSYEFSKDDIIFDFSTLDEEVSSKLKYPNESEVLVKEGSYQTTIIHRFGQW